MEIKRKQYFIKYDFYEYFLGFALKFIILILLYLHICMTRYENCKLSSKSDSSAALSGKKIQKIKLHNLVLRS